MIGKFWSQLPRTGRSFAAINTTLVLYQDVYTYVVALLLPAKAGKKLRPVVADLPGYQAGLTAAGVFVLLFNDKRGLS